MKLTSRVFSIVPIIVTAAVPGCGDAGNDVAPEHPATAASAVRQPDGRFFVPSEAWTRIETEVSKSGRRFEVLPPFRGWTMGAKAADPVEMRATSGPTIGVRRVDAAASAGHLVDGGVEYEAAAPGVDVRVYATERGVEDLWRFHQPRTSWAYDVDLPQGYRLQASEAVPGLAEVRDANDVARLRVWAKAAWDANGADVGVHLRVEGSRIVVGIEEGAAWPVMVDPEWSGTEAMAYPRSGATVTPLPTGKVLIAGGDLSGRGVSELFDPATNTFTVSGALNWPRSGHFGALLPNGRVVLLGGAGTEEAGVDDVELYDPWTETFSAEGTVTGLQAPIASMLPSGRVLSLVGDNYEIYDVSSRTTTTGAAYDACFSCRRRATLLQTGQVLLTGEHLKVFEEYPPTFSDGPELLLRYGHSATELPDGRVLTAGGDYSGFPSEITQVLKVAGTSEAGPPMLTARTLHSAVVLADGRLMLGGGFDAAGASRTTEILDEGLTGFTEGPVLPTPTATHQLVQIADGRVLAIGENGVAATLEPTEWWREEPELGRLLVPRRGHTATTLPSGDIVIAGGADELSDTSVEILDGATLKARPGGHLNQYRIRHTATLLPDSGRILLVGGWPHGQSHETWELFDPEEGVSVEQGKLGANRTFHSATGLPDGRVVIVGGAASPTYEQDRSIEVWDPKTRTTEIVAPLDDWRTAHAAVLVGERVLIVGGEPGGLEPTMNSAVWFDPATNEVSAAPPMNFARRRHAALLDSSSGNLVVMGCAPPEEFDPITEQWRILGDGTSAWAGASTVLANGDMLYAGGWWSVFGATTQTMLYSSASQSLADVALMRVARGEATVSSLEDGRAVVVGGTPGEYVDLPGGHGLRSMEVFEPQDKGFRFLEQSFWPHQTATLLRTGDLLLAGGTELGSDACRLWSPTTQSSVAIASMSEDRRGHSATVLDSGTVLIAGGNFWKTPTNTTELFDPEGMFTAGPPMARARNGHRATRMPSGQVLLTGGSDDPIAEIFDPITGTIRDTGALNEPRSNHAAVLAADRHVIIAGGEAPDGSPVRSIESYDPDTGVFQRLAVEAPVGGPTVGAAEATGELLLAGPGVGYVLDTKNLSLRSVGGMPPVPSAAFTLVGGGVAVCGDGTGLVEGSFTCTRLLPGEKWATPMFEGESITGSVFARLAGGGIWVGASSHLGEPLTAVFRDLPPNVKHPRVLGYESHLRIGASETVTGERFATHPAFDDQTKPMSGIVPMVKLVPANGGPAVTCPIQEWSDTRIKFTPPSTTFHGPVWLHVLVNGVPSEGRFLVLEPRVSGSACAIDGECELGHCVEGVCCDTSCDTPCLSCLASRKSEGEDGVCGVIPAGTDPKDACEEETPESCGTTGVCNGSGACELTPDGTQCTPTRLCLAGQCAATLGEPCTSSAECAADQSCSADGVCHRVEAGQPVIDSGSCSQGAGSPARSTNRSWLFAAMAVLAMVAFRKRQSSLAMGLAATVVVLCGCSDESGDASSASLDAGESDVQLPDAAPSDAPELGEVTVRVFTSLGAPFGEHALRPALTPIADSLLELERADGTSEIVQTNEVGVAVLNDIDWSEGKLRYTAYKPGYALWSDELLPSATQATAILWPLEPPALATVRGTLAESSESDFVQIVSSNTYPGASRSVGSAFQLGVAADEPFSLIAVGGLSESTACCTSLTETAWFHLEHTGAPADTTLDVALTEKLTPRRVSGAMRPPSPYSSDSPEPSVVVESHEHNQLLGTAVETTFTNSIVNDEAKYVVEYVEPPGTAGSRTVYRWQFGKPPSSYVVSLLVAEGFPADDHVADGFLGIPEVTSNQPVMSLLDEFAWDPLEPTDAMLVLTSDDGWPLWFSVVRGDATSIGLPTPPAQVDILELLGQGPFTTHLILLDDYDLDNGIWRKQAWVDRGTMTL